MDPDQLVKDQEALKRYINGISGQVKEMQKIYQILNSSGQTVLKKEQKNEENVECQNKLLKENESLKLKVNKLEYRIEFLLRYVEQLEKK